MLCIALTVAIAEIGSTGADGDGMVSGIGTSASHGIALSGRTAVFLEGSELVTADVSDPARPRETARRRLESCAEARQCADGRDGNPVLLLWDGFLFVSTRRHGIQIYDVSDRGEPEFVGCLLPIDPARPPAVGVEGGRLVCRGCAPTVFSVMGRREKPKVVASPPAIGYLPRAALPARPSRARGTLAAAAGPGRVLLPEKRGPWISSEDSWYVTTCLHVPERSETPATLSAPGEQQGAQEDSAVDAKRRRAATIARLKAAVTPEARRPIEVAHVSNAPSPYRYSTLELMVNRRAAVERYR